MPTRRPRRQSLLSAILQRPPAPAAVLDEDDRTDEELLAELRAEIAAGGVPGTPQVLEAVAAYERWLADAGPAWTPPPGYRHDLPDRVRVLAWRDRDGLPHSDRLLVVLRDLLEALAAATGETMPAMDWPDWM